MTNEPHSNQDAPQTTDETTDRTTDEETHMSTDDPTNENTGDAAPASENTADVGPADGSPASDSAADSGANPFVTEQADAEPTRPVPPAEQPAGTSWPAPEQPQPATGWTQQQSASPGYGAPPAGQPADQPADQSGAQYGAGQYGAQYGAQYGPGQSGAQYGPGQYGGQYAAGGYGGAVPPGGYPPGGYPGGYPPGGYGYGYPAAPPRTDDKAIWALVSSIAGFVLFPLVLHVVGWVLANQSLRSIRESGGALRGEGVAKTARVLGIVGVVLSVLGLVAAVLFFAIAIPLGIFAASNNDLDLDIGSETVTPTSLAMIDGEDFSHDIGEVTYDLSGLDFAGRAADMSVELGAGTLTIEVPDDVTVNLDAEVGAGDLDVFGTSTSGIEVSREGTFEGDDSGEGVLDLMVRVDVGELDVSRG